MYRKILILLPKGYGTGIKSKRKIVKLVGCLAIQNLYQYSMSTIVQIKFPVASWKIQGATVV